MNLLKDGGILQFKTDNVGLFDFTLEEIEAMGLAPTVVTRDLHSSEYDADNVRTEYEEAFSSRGVNINMLRICKPIGFSVAVSPELSADRSAHNYYRKRED
jgi:tRNA (guanine-N7-)-methyltransferase